MSTPAISASSGAKGAAGSISPGISCGTSGLLAFIKHAKSHDLWRFLSISDDCKGLPVTSKSMKFRWKINESIQTFTKFHDEPLAPPSRTRVVRWNEPASEGQTSVGSWKQFEKYFPRPTPSSLSCQPMRISEKNHHFAQRHLHAEKCSTGCLAASKLQNLVDGAATLLFLKYLWNGKQCPHATEALPGRALSQAWAYRSESEWCN